MNLSFLRLLLIFPLINSFDVKYFDDSILYQISTSKRDILDNRLEDANNAQKLVPIVSSDDERYYCILPEIVTKVSFSVLNLFKHLLNLCLSEEDTILGLHWTNSGSTAQFYL